MNHYTLEQWVDYIRSVVAEPDRSAMGSHLAANCPQCRRALVRAQAVQSVVLDNVTVPERFLANARAIFPPSARKSKSSTQELLAGLLFDSYAQPALAGARGAFPEGRRLVYALEGVRIEFMIDMEAAGRNAVITGQASIHGSPELPPIRLVAGKTVLDQAQPNAFGEFQISFPVRSSLRLVMMVPHLHQAIYIPLDLRTGGIWQNRQKE